MVGAVSRRTLLGASSLVAIGGAAGALGPGPHAAAAAEAEEAAGQRVLDEVWTDAARDGRALPVRLRLPPPDVPPPWPPVVISHGLGGSRAGLAYLGRALSEAGFLAVHIQHPGTDSSLWQGAADLRSAMAAAALDAGQALARLQDGIFALDELERRGGEGAPGPLSGRVDVSRMAAAGHSYGAWTVQHLLGQRLPGGDRGLPLPDARLRAGVLLSPIPQRGLPPRLAFGRIAVPLLHVTGTADHGYIEGARPEDRLQPFRSVSGVPQVLAVLGGATHGAFADEAAAGGRWADPTYHGRTAALAVAFLRTVLLGDASAAQVLRSGASGLLAPGDRFELKDWPADET